MIDGNALLSQFYRERLSGLTGDDPAHPLADHVYVAPDGLPANYPGDQRAIVVQLIPGQPSIAVSLTGMRFYVRTYGRAGDVGNAGDVAKSGRDALYIANYLYQLSYQKVNNRWILRHGHHINPDVNGRGQWFAKWIMYDSYPAPDSDADDRPIGFMVATVRADLFRGD